MPMSNPIKIDKGVPITGTNGRPEKYPWSEMQPGDSFLIHTRKPITSFSNAANKARHRHPGKRWATRTVKGGIRIWRVK